MPNLSDINKRDETASKPDTGKYGLEPFMGASGYAMVVCCPIYTVVGIVKGILHKVKKRKHKRTGEQQSGEQEVGEKAHTTSNDRTGEEGGFLGKKFEQSSPSGLKRAASSPRVTHGFKGDPNNPRECNPECPDYGKDHCVAHQRSDPGRSTSPGLLAV